MKIWHHEAWRSRTTGRIPILFEKSQQLSKITNPTRASLFLLILLSSYILLGGLKPTATNDAAYFSQSGATYRRKAGVASKRSGWGAYHYGSWLNKRCKTWKTQLQRRTEVDWSYTRKHASNCWSPSIKSRTSWPQATKPPPHQTSQLFIYHFEFMSTEAFFALKDLFATTIDRSDERERSPIIWSLPSKEPESTRSVACTSVTQSLPSEGQYWLHVHHCQLRKLLTRYRIWCIGSSGQKSRFCNDIPPGKASDEEKVGTFQETSLHRKICNPKLSKIGRGWSSAYTSTSNSTESPDAIILLQGQAFTCNTLKPDDATNQKLIKCFKYVKQGLSNKKKVELVNVNCSDRARCLWDGQQGS